MADVVNAILSFLIGQWPILAGVVVAIVVFVVILRSMSRSSRRRPAAAPAHRVSARVVGLPQDVESTTRREAPEIPDDETARFKAITDDLRADNGLLKQQIERLSNLNAMIGPLVKELNSNVDRGKFGPLVVRVLDRLFGPARVLLCLAENEDSDDLTVVTLRAVDGVKEGAAITPVEGSYAGFPGLAAKKRVVIARDDLRYETNLTRQRVAATDWAKEIQVVAPLMYRGRLTGLIGMAGWDEKAGDVKSLFGMVGDLVAMAFANYVQFRKIEALANSDPLTRLHNKGYFLEVCETEFEDARRREQAVSILMFDVDNFKHYNDTNGHLAGDRLLKKLADLLRETVKDRGTLARFGGEEFIVLLRVGTDEALQVAERVRKAVMEHAFDHREKQPLGFISVSGGVGTLGFHGTTIEEIIEAADEGLYEGKKSGRNQVKVVAPRKVAVAAGA